MNKNISTVDKRLLETKPYVSYPNDIKDAINYISFIHHWNPKYIADPYGSYIYRIQKYPGDVDLYEVIDYFKTEGDTIEFFIKTIKNIIRHLGKQYIYSEFKAGIDENYEINIGTLQNGRFTPSDNIYSVLFEKFEDGLFTDDEYESMIRALHLIGDDFDSVIYDYVYNLIREKRILRWTKDEVLQGFKKTNKNKIYLEDALQEKTMIKLDLIVLLNNRYMEITNLIFLNYKQYDGENISYIPIGLNWEDLFKSNLLNIDIEKLYYSNKFYSPFKICKRMYAVMRQKSNFRYFNQLKYVLTGEVSQLYQIKSELDVIIIIIERTKKPDYNIIDKQLQDIKSRLNYIIGISKQDVIEFSKIINFIGRSNDKELRYEAIIELRQQIKYIIEFLTIVELNKVKLNPIPDFFLPEFEKYDRNIIRSPKDKPTKFYKEIVDKYFIEDHR